MQKAPNCAKNDWLCGYVRETAKHAIPHPPHFIFASGPEPDNNCDLRTTVVIVYLKKSIILKFVYNSDLGICFPNFLV